MMGSEGRSPGPPSSATGEGVVLGCFGAPFGVEGWVKVNSYTDPPERIAGYPGLQVGPRGDRLTVTDWKRVGHGQIAVRLSGVATREQAALFNGAEVWVSRADLPPAGPGEYYLVDLIGLEAFNREGEALGRVAEILELPAHPVLVVRGDRERLVPLVRERLAKVDLASGRLTLDWHRDD